MYLKPCEVLGRLRNWKMIKVLVSRKNTNIIILLLILCFRKLVTVPVWPLKLTKIFVFRLEDIKPIDCRLYRDFFENENRNMNKFV